MKPILQKELRLLSAVCRTLDPDVKTGEQHPVLTFIVISVDLLIQFVIAVIFSNNGVSDPVKHVC